MTTMDITDARTNWSQMQDRVRDERVIRVTKHGKEAFAVVDTEYLSAVLETIEIMSDPDSHKVFLQSLEDIRNGRVTDHDDVVKELLDD